MKKTASKYGFIVLFFSLNSTIGQVKIEGNINFHPDEYKEIVIDTSKQNIYYNYTYLTDPKDKSEVHHAVVVLEIGTNYSKFVDLHKLKSDSLQKKHSHLSNVGVKEINQQLSIFTKVGFQQIVFNHFQDDTLTFQAEVHSTKYNYKEKTPNLNWQLKNESKTILGYKVSKAIVNYSGRNWVAWHTQEIPISLGPYVFGNLPGLILELYDDKNNFHFIAVGLDNKQNEIYKRVESNIVETSKENFFKAEKNYYENPEFYINVRVRGNIDLKKTPYNPIELID